MTTELTVQQQRRLEACEEDIRTSIGNIKASMKLIGQALRIVRDEQLYLSTHATFEGYVGQQWNLSRARAYQLIDFACAVFNLSECEVLSTIVDTISEGATRQLSGLEPDKQRQVVMEASQGGTVTPTARAIREVIDVCEPKLSDSPTIQTAHEITPVATQLPCSLKVDYVPPPYDRRELAIGQCVSSWKSQCPDTRTDTHFGKLFSLRDSQVISYRRAWERFGHIAESCPSLSWSHFKAAITWPDAIEYLEWAEANKASVQLMTIHRRHSRVDRTR